jgi:glycosyltransferase involved in cell wall biosynthesis
VKLLLAIRSLDIGGAERQFIELAKGIDKEAFDVTVCTMYGGRQEESVKAIDGLRYVNLQKSGRYDLTFYFRYKRFLEERQPDIIYSFLGEMNLFSLWCRPKKTKVVWGFRASNMDLSRYGKVSEALFALQKHFSGRVDCIVANSQASVGFHAEKGFNMSRAVVIPNGIDTETFRPDPVSRKRFRETYGVGEGDRAVGIVARLDPMKGYEILAEAMARVLSGNEKLHFFAAGGGDASIRQRCEAKLAQFGGRVHWLGSRNDVASVYNGLDLYVSSSLTEGFSNTVAEAMACGVPCVVTDVGDSAMIVGKTGAVVPPDDPEALADAIGRMLARSLRVPDPKVRGRIVENFSTESMIQRTERELKACAAS